MRISKLPLAFALFVSIPALSVSAQDAPAAAKQLLSPRDTSRADIGSAKVWIDYGRPSKRDRPIFGGLVPYDRVWRTGANSATTLVTDKPLLIGKAEIPAGRYTVYTVPGKTEWQLIINKQTGQWGTEYDQSKDLVRIPMAVKTLTAPVEKFEITIDKDMLHLRWDTTEAVVSIAEKK